jgi:hypothetical protein
MAIEIVDFPIKNGDFPVRYVSSPEGNAIKSDHVSSWQPSRSASIAARRLGASGAWPLCTNSRLTARRADTADADSAVPGNSMGDLMGIIWISWNHG